MVCSCEKLSTMTKTRTKWLLEIFFTRQKYRVEILRNTEESFTEDLLVKLLIFEIIHGNAISKLSEYAIPYPIRFSKSLFLTLGVCQHTNQ